MNIVRRAAWILTGMAALPGLLLGVVTAYAFLVGPVVFALGFVVGRSTAGIGFAIGLFFALVVGFAVGLGAAWGDNDWLFFATYGTSALLAVLATFKLGTEARVRLR